MVNKNFYVITCLADLGEPSYILVPCWVPKFLLQGTNARIVSPQPCLGVPIPTLKVPPMLVGTIHWWPAT